MGRRSLLTISRKSLSQEGALEIKYKTTLLLYHYYYLSVHHQRSPVCWTFFKPEIHQRVDWQTFSSKAHNNNLFHPETLYEHLFMTANACHEYACSLKLISKYKKHGGWVISALKNIGLDSPWCFYLVGFLHDIGKHGALRPISLSDYKKKGICYTKGHGVIAGAMFDS